MPASSPVEIEYVCDFDPTSLSATWVTKLTLNSIHFPADLRTKADPQGGLVPSEAR